MNISKPEATLRSLPGELLHIDGSDATGFLHAQLSSSVPELLPGHWQWSAWLNVQGRVRALLQLGYGPDGHYHALLRGGSSDRLGQALQPFVVRARVTIQASSKVSVLDDALPEGQFEIHDDELVFGMGPHSWRLTVQNLPQTSTDETMQRARLEEIRRGWPWIPDNFLDTLLPPALGLEHLAAVRFDKGCFPGQEVAARLHFRGGHKYSLARLRLSNPVRPGQIVASPHAYPLKILGSASSEPGFEALAVLHQSLEPSTLDSGIEILERFTP